MLPDPKCDLQRNERLPPIAGESVSGGPKRFAKVALVFILVLDRASLPARAMRKNSAPSGAYVVLANSNHLDNTGSGNLRDCAITANRYGRRMISAARDTATTRSGSKMELSIRLAKIKPS